MRGLTPKQKRVYDFIAAYIRRRGVAPSYEEIRDEFGLRSLSTVHKHLVQIERKGWIETPWQSQKRALSLADAKTGGAALLPLLGLVAAGEPIEALEAPDEVEVPESLLRGGESFALRVRGESMIDDGIRDGDIIIVKRQATAETGQTVVVVVDGEATVKKFHPKGNKVELRPANAAMKPIVVPAAKVHIRGVVVGLMRQYK